MIEKIDTELSQVEAPLQFGSDVVAYGACESQFFCRKRI